MTLSDVKIFSSEFIIPEGVQAIGSHAFDFSNCTSIILSKTLEIIRSYGFCLCKASELMLPSTVKEIGYKAFAGCNNLEKIVIEGLTELITSEETLSYSTSDNPIPRTIYCPTKVSIDCFADNILKEFLGLPYNCKIEYLTRINFGR